MSRDRNDPDQFQAEPLIPGGFRAAFATAVVSAGFTVKVWQGTSVVCLNHEQQEQTLSLKNVYRRCQNASRGEWRDIIGEFVRHMSAATREVTLPDRLEVVADQLVIRIGTPFSGDLGEGQPWCRAVGESGLVMNLVIDHPNFVSYVGPKLIHESGRDADYWLETARANLRQRTTDPYFTPIGDEGGILLGCTSDTYDAARALILDDLLDDPTGYGWFVTLPTRDVLIVLPVTSGNVSHLHVLKRFAENNHRHRPYPITDQVFWIQQRNWYRFPIELTTDAVQVRPPVEFLGILDQLNSDPAEDGPA